jgi:hypothetical protein
MADQDRTNDAEYDGEYCPWCGAATLVVDEDAPKPYRYCSLLGCNWNSEAGREGPSEQRRNLALRLRRGPRTWDITLSYDPTTYAPDSAQVTIAGQDAPVTHIARKRDGGTTTFRLQHAGAPRTLILHRRLRREPYESLDGMRLERVDG